MKPGLFVKRLRQIWFNGSRSPMYRSFQDSALLLTWFKLAGKQIKIPGLQIPESMLVFLTDDRLKILSKSITVRLETQVKAWDREENSWKKRVHVYTALQRNPRRDIYVPGLRGMCMGRMEDGFREALLKMSVFRRDSYRIGLLWEWCTREEIRTHGILGIDRTACYSGKVSDTHITGGLYLVRFLTVRQEWTEVVTRVLLVFSE